MSVSSEFIAFLTDHLAGLGDIRVKRMFGGAGVYCDGVMFGLIADDVLYLKSNADGAGAFEEEGCSPFTYEGKGKPMQMSYWRAPDRLYDDPDDMTAWARAALSIALAAKSKKAAPAKRRSRKSSR